MFGSIVANTAKLEEQEEILYKSSYCGLCRILGKQHGAVCRATVNYDITFFGLILSSLYEAEAETGSERCIVHPFRKHRYRVTNITEYISDMNIVLAYYNLLDDWTDEQKLYSLAGAKILEKEYKAIVEKYPDKCNVIDGCMKELSAIESSGIMNPDIPSNCFGKITAEVMRFRDDEYAPRLQDFGWILGKFIYVMDACIDLKTDLKRENYNPMTATPTENFSSILELLAADCIKRYEELEISRNKGLIENILYSGMWTKWELHKS